MANFADCFPNQSREPLLWLSANFANKTKKTKDEKDPSKTLVDLLKVDLTGLLPSGARVLGCKAAELRPSPY